MYSVNAFIGHRLAWVSAGFPFHLSVLRSALFRAHNTMTPYLDSVTVGSHSKEPLSQCTASWWRSETFRFTDPAGNMVLWEDVFERIDSEGSQLFL